MNKMNKTRDPIVKMSYMTAIKELMVSYGSVIEVFGLNSIIEELISLLKSISSHIVIAEVLNTLHKLDQKFEMSFEHKLTIMKTTKQLLQNNCNHVVKNECLSLLVDLAPINHNNNESASDSGYFQVECIAIIKLLRDFSHYHDSRVRSTALSSIVSLILFK